MQPTRRHIKVLLPRLLIMHAFSTSICHTNNIAIFMFLYYVVTWNVCGDPVLPLLCAICIRLKNTWRRRSFSIGRMKAIRWDSSTRLVVRSCDPPIKPVSSYCSTGYYVDTLTKPLELFVPVVFCFQVNSSSKTLSRNDKKWNDSHFCIPSTVYDNL